MKKLLIILLTFVASIAFAQSPSKYFIYFKDKGIDKTTQLSKSSIEYNQALNSLSERSIKRRIKNFGESIVTYEDLPIKSDYIEAIKSSGAKIVWKLKWFNALSAYLNENQFNEISNYAFVDKIEKVKTLNYKRDEKLETKLNKTFGVADTNYNLDYGPSLTQVELSDVPAVHDAGFAGEGVLIGILDAGFAWQNHPALKSRNVLAERDFVNGDYITDDGDGSHGAAVLSLIGGFDEGSIIGPAYNAQFVLAKTEYIYTETHVEEDNYAAALEWMDSLGVDITNTSLGYTTFDEGEGDYTYADMDGKTTIVTRASELAFSKGILTISSAGNMGNSSWKFISAPSDGFNTIAVGAVNSNKELASFSSVGPTFDGRIKPEFVAQGVNCYTARAYSNGYKYGSGTSYSAPIATGIASQLLSAFPYLKNKQLRTILIEASDSVENPNNEYGHGILSALSAVEFPNLKEEDGKYILNKMFIKNIINESDSVYVAIHENRTNAIPVYSMKKNDHYYFLDLPQYPEGTELRISFSAQSANGDSSYFFNEVYKFIYGTLDVVSSTEIINSNPIPDNFNLSQNYPNPFNPLTRFELEVPDEMFVSIIIYNILGEKVKRITAEYFNPGVYKYYWNGTTDGGNKVSTGVYILSATSKLNTISKKMIYIK
ncbi:MAG: S8 family serine peptidase [Melioribacteraceae bacterium]|nr:S8 family serine peptidase [Melioribacteraceae bacterium]